MKAPFGLIIALTASVFYFNSCACESGNCSSYSFDQPPAAQACNSLLDQCPVQTPFQSTPVPNCGNEPLTRTLYQQFTVANSNQCRSETQYRRCDNGTLTPWSGSYSFPTCTVHSQTAGALPLWQFSQLTYAGGFRVTGASVGEGENSNLAYSPGIFTIDTAQNTLFTVSHDYEQGFGEIALPALTLSEDAAEFEIAETIIQNFVDIYQTERDVTGIESYFRVSGLHKFANQLMVNYFNWYDAGGTETDTTMLFKDAANLGTSDIIGPFQLGGAAHAAGWISEIPEHWQAALGGTHLTGMSQGSIVSRLSVGPSAFIFNPNDELLSATEGSALTNKTAMDFSLKNMMVNYQQYPAGSFGTDDVLYNRIDRKNNLWTINSNATHAFIIPNTSTYFVIGSSSGHRSGLGYKITQDSGRLCGGPCAFEADDYYNYYWLFDVNDFVKVLNDEMEPYDVRPYDYGKFNTIGNKKGIGGGYYDANQDRLYISLKNGDPIPTYGKPPLFLAYQLNVQD